MKKFLRDYRAAFSGLSRQNWIISAVILINRATFMSVPFMSLYVTQSLHRRPADAGLLFAAFGGGTILGSLLGGKLTDRIGFRSVQIIFIVSGGLVLMTFPAIKNFNLLLAFTIIAGVFIDGFRPANFTATAAYAFDGTVTRAFSLNRMASNIGWAIGASSGGLVAAYSYRLLFTIDGGASILGGLIILIFLRSKSSHKVTMPVKVKSAVKPWLNPQFMKFIVLLTIFAVCIFLTFRIMPLFLKESWGLGETAIGSVLGLNGLLIALFEMMLVSKLVKSRNSLFYITVGVCMIGMSLTFLVLPGNVHIGYAIAFMSFFSFGEMFALPFVDTYVTSLAGKGHEGLYAAAYQLSFSIGQLIGPSGGFYMAQKYGFTSLWMLVGFVLLTCAICFSRLISPDSIAFAKLYNDN
jgi:predicted MFS family arabinose efflux permease